MSTPHPLGRGSHALAGEMETSVVAAGQLPGKSGGEALCLLLNSLSALSQLTHWEESPRLCRATRGCTRSSWEPGPSSPEQDSELVGESWPPPRASTGLNTAGDSGLFKGPKKGPRHSWGLAGRWEASSADPQPAQHPRRSDSSLPSGTWLFFLHSYFPFSSFASFPVSHSFLKTCH